jgi:hypothetical protein
MIRRILSRFQKAELVVCTACDNAVHPAEIVKRSSLDLDPGGGFELTFCRSCALEVIQNTPGGTLPPAEERAERREKARQEEETVALCSFCHKDQFDVVALFGVLRFYRIDSDDSWEIHPVSHDAIFLAAYGSQSPTLVASVYICNECVE